MSFLDAYSGYHQIKLKKSDQEKTSFITPYGAYCYTSMSMGLKNAGATYQRTMQKCLQSQIGRNVHVYVDDIVIKTKERGTLLEDIEETFTNLRRYQMKLNPAKCMFGVPATSFPREASRPIRTRSRQSKPWSRQPDSATSNGLLAA